MIHHNQTNAAKGFIDAYRFVLDYINSPGYKRRLANMPAAIEDFVGSAYDPFNDTDDYTYLPVQKNEAPTASNFLSGVEFGLDEPNAFYDNGTNAISFGNNGVFDVLPHEAWDYIATHELGHALDNNFVIFKNYSDGTYDNTDMKLSDLFTILRNSESYKRQRDAFVEDDEHSSEQGFTDAGSAYDWQYFPNFVSEYTDDTHDGKPAESYADLLELRKRLKDAGVYNSNQAIIPFTRGLMSLYKLLVPEEDRGRTFENFSDDDIIWMINNIAQNKTNNRYSLKGQYA